MSTLKPVLVAGCIVALDKYALNQTNLNNSLYFGLAGAIGVYTRKWFIYGCQNP